MKKELIALVGAIYFYIHQAVWALTDIGSPKSQIYHVATIMCLILVLLFRADRKEKEKDAK